MELGEKLQELRKSKGLTQEELASALYISRTAISKWESGRGYPSIDSLKEISKFFSVTIDDLLSSEKILYIAEKENKSNIQSVCNLLFGIVDLMTMLLIILPLYPKLMNDFIYSVNLIEYTKIAPIISIIYWVMFASLALIGVIKIFLAQLKTNRWQSATTAVSIAISVISVLALAITRQAYAVVIAFLLLTVKVIIAIRNLMHCAK